MATTRPELAPCLSGTHPADAQRRALDGRSPPSRSRRWYGGLAVRGSRVLTVVLLGASPLAGALASGCGSSAQQDASEPQGTFAVRVTHASFPVRQSVAREERLVLSVRNTSGHAVSNVAVAVNSFDYISNYPNLAARKRPVWVVDHGPGPQPRRPVETVEVDAPGGGATANYNVWALGRLPAGATRSFVWDVTPVKPGVHTVSYRVYAGLNGKARAQLAGGGIPGGSFKVAIAGSPPPTHVNPQTGRVEEGAYSPAAQSSNG